MGRILANLPKRDINKFAQSQVWQTCRRRLVVQVGVCGEIPRSVGTLPENSGRRFRFWNLFGNCSLYAPAFSIAITPPGPPRKKKSFSTLGTKTFSDNHADQTISHYRVIEKLGWWHERRL
jgi:hypothetical protein